MLLGQDSVQKELQLTSPQVQALKTISENQRTAMSQAYQLDREERGEKIQKINQQTETMIGNVLTPQQQQRLMQISLQQQGTRAFERPDVVQGLGLTPEQLTQIQQIRDATSAEMAELFRKQMEEIRKAAEQKVVAVFTPEQQAKWNETRGSTFEGEIVPPSRFGPPRDRSPGEEANRGSRSRSSDSPSASGGRQSATPKAGAMTPAGKKPVKKPVKTPVKKTPTAKTKQPPAQPATNPPPGS
ncbi:MAG TPA: hypothetical protein VG433_08090 [Pirellulales bacterium]|jgi:hypothetical protein|nr:hypothetical protein [Pirellulales bacterium]